MSEINTNVGPEDSAALSQADEIAAVFERKRSERATGAVNASPFWQVRIGWGSASSTTFPPFTFDVKDSCEDAEYCARHAATWKHGEDDLQVVSTCVRGPGESEWRSVDIPKTAAA